MMRDYISDFFADSGIFEANLLFWQMVVNAAELLKVGRVIDGESKKLWANLINTL
jgi:hypothetical protein